VRRRREPGKKLTEMTTELDKLVLFMNRFPALAKAITGSQSTFDDEAEPTDDDMLFITRVTDAPVQVEGRLRPGWNMANYVVSHTDRPGA
jgi:hypothetical protein